jgi:SAM-dependent methyltransferase
VGFSRQLLSPGSPGTRRGGLSDFDVHEDVTRADDFLAAIIGDLRSNGVARPRILEVGAGVHPISLRTCDAEDTTVVVSDISLVMQILASIMHTNNPAVLTGRAAFACFDMMYPPFRDGSFDVICICAALHHIPAPVGFLQRLTPMLSEHGRFVAVREPCLVNPFEPAYIAELSNGFNEQMFELPEWNEIIARGGLEIDRAVIDFGCSLKFSARVAGMGSP